MSFFFSLSTKGNKDLEYYLNGAIKMNQGQQIKLKPTRYILIGINTKISTLGD